MSVFCVSVRCIIEVHVNSQQNGIFDSFLTVIIDIRE